MVSPRITNKISWTNCFLVFWNIAIRNTFSRTKWNSNLLTRFRAPATIPNELVICLQRVMQNNYSEKTSEIHFKASLKNFFLSCKLSDWIVIKYLIVPSHVDPNLTLAFFGPALIKLPPIKATFYSIQNLRNWKKIICVFLWIFCHFLISYNYCVVFIAVLCFFLFNIILTSHYTSISLSCFLLRYFCLLKFESQFFPTKLLNFLMRTYLF